MENWCANPLVVVRPLCYNSPQRRTACPVPPAVMAVANGGDGGRHTNKARSVTMKQRVGALTRRGRGLGALGVVVGAGLAFLTPVNPAGASSGGTLFVNASSGHDTGTCRLSNHPCQTIAY